MAMEGEDAAAATTTTTSRRLRSRPAKPTQSLQEDKNEDEEEGRSLGPRISSSLKRKANITVENLYLQGNYKDPLPTPLETIFESPRPIRGQRPDSPDVPPLMARRKLKRLCVFGSHYQPTRGKLKQRKERALRMRQLTGVRVPLGKTFSEDDVLAALSCLTEEEAATTFLLQDPEREVLDFPHTSVSDTLVEKVTNVLSSLQMDCEPSFASTSQAPQETTSALPSLSREQRRKRRSGLVVSPVSSASSDNPSLAREKRLKRRSGLVFPEKTGSLSTPPASPQSASGECPPQPRPSKTARAQRKRHKPFPEANQSTTAPRVPRVRPGNKRTPDTSPATMKKKQCTPATSTQDPAPPSRRVKGRGKSKGKRRMSGVQRSLYHHNVFATDSPNNSLTPSNTSSPATIPTSNTPPCPTTIPTSNTPPCPTTIPTSNTPPCPTTIPTSNTPSSPIILTSIPETPPLAPLPTNKRDHSPKLVEGDKEAPTVATGGASPTSPSSRMAALSLYTSPSPIIKPRKIRRRSARLSLGSEAPEELRKTTDNDLPLGTFWLAHSPLERKAEAMRAAQGGGGDDVGDRGSDDPPPPPPPSTTSTRKKKQSKGRRRSNQFLPIPERMEIEDTITTITTAITTIPTCSINTSSPSTHPHSNSDTLDPLTSPLHSTTLLHNTKSPTLITSLTSDMNPPSDPQATGGEDRKTDTHQGKGKEVMGANVLISPYSSSEGSAAPSPSPKNTAFCEPVEGCNDLSTPSPIPAVTPASAPTLTLSPGQLPVIAITPSPAQPLATLTPSPGQLSATLTPSLGQAPSPVKSSATLTPSPEQLPSPAQPSTTLTPEMPRGDHNTNPEEDWDSPIVAGILTNETLIRMGQVYYGTPLSTPSPARV